MPERIQRKRTRGWRMPANAVYVGRPTKWGNPFSMNDEQVRHYLEVIVPKGKRSVATSNMRQQIVDQFHLYLLQDSELMAQLSELRGKDLACWCNLSSPCHADVLLRLANEIP